MKKLIVLLTILLYYFSANGQDTLLLSRKWQAFFREYDRSAQAKYTSVDYNKKFMLGQYYEGLIIFKDTTQASRPIMLAYPGFENLCDPKQKLLGTYDRPDLPYEIDKKIIKYFVFHDLLFAFDDLNRRKVKFAVPPAFWSALILDGPVRITKHAYMTVYGGKALKAESGVIYKNEDSIGTDVNSVGGLSSFKKFGAKTFADYPDLAAKIANEQPGYLKNDILKILMEYNAWVQRENPEAYEKSLLLGKYWR